MIFPPSQPMRFRPWGEARIFALNMLRRKLREMISRPKLMNSQTVRLKMQQLNQKRNQQLK